MINDDEFKTTVFISIDWLKYNNKSIENPIVFANEIYWEKKNYRKQLRYEKGEFI